MSIFSSYVVKEFRKVAKEFGFKDYENDKLGLLSDLFKFTFHSKFKKIMFNSSFNEFLSLRDCIDINNSFSESTWLFLRNGVRTMFEYHLSSNQYMRLFKFYFDILVPQLRLSYFYNEQKYFVDNGISVSALLSFYDFLPDYHYDWAFTWYRTFGVHSPLGNGRQDSDISIPFNMYVDSLGSWIFDSIRQRTKNLIFNHYKHHSRSDFLFFIIWQIKFLNLQFRTTNSKGMLLIFLSLIFFRLSLVLCFLSFV